MSATFAPCAPFAPLLTPDLALRMHADAVLHAARARSWRADLRTLYVSNPDHLGMVTRREALNALRREERHVQCIAIRIEALLRRDAAALLASRGAHPATHLTGATA